MIHLDLFSGIGGFAYAADQVWDNVEHIFCDNDKFCQQVLNKHWPEAKIYDDIKSITADSIGKGWTGRLRKTQGQHRLRNRKGSDQKPFLLTGGFPCQPFSAAGKRRGTEDDRYLWPEMLRVIRLTEPKWVIAENVSGIATWDGGLVFEQVCTDLEASNYEVQPFVIPAVAVNAPHRRDRVWFVARNTQHDGLDGTENPEGGAKGNDNNQKRPEQVRQLKGTSPLRFSPESWGQDWLEVATYASRMDDGLPNRVDRLKSLGNAIVPQVAVEIMRGMV